MVGINPLPLLTLLLLGAPSIFTQVGVSATPTAKSTAPLAKIDHGTGPSVLDFKEIPVGAKIEFGPSGHEEEEESPISSVGKSGSEVVPRGLSKRHDCNGSIFCGTAVTSHWCRTAVAAFDDNTWYCGVRRRVRGDRYLQRCLAVFEGKNDMCVIGWKVKELFLRIYTEVGCTRCGRYYDPNATLRFDYCDPDGGCWEA